MTRSQRAQVVELLRCVADCNSLVAAGVHPLVNDPPQWQAWEAKRAVQAKYLTRSDTNEGYRWVLLEAAARVENEEWP